MTSDTMSGTPFVACHGQLWIPKSSHLPDFSVSFTDDKGGPQENTMRNIRKKAGFLEQ